LFRNRDGEIRSLLKRIDDLLAADPDYQAEKRRVSRAETLRQRLIELREEEIAPAFPDSPPAKSLLSPELLEEFIQRRPKTKDDWFKFPQPLRTGVESKQVAKYLARVLQIVSEGDAVNSTAATPKHTS